MTVSIKEKLEESFRKDGWKEGTCICCREPFTEKNVFTEAGWSETKISQTCEKCFDEMFSEDNFDDDGE